MKKENKSNFTNEQKAAAVLSVVLEKQTTLEAAQSMGVDVSQVEAWRVQYLQNMGAAFKETKPSITARLQRRPFMAAGAALAVVVCLFVTSEVLSATDICPPDGFFCFYSDSPAKASEVNTNFKILADSLQSKIGPVAENAITVSNTIQIDTKTNTDIGIEGGDASGNLLIESSVAPPGALYLNHHSGNSIQVGGDLYMEGTHGITTAGKISTGSISATGAVSGGSISATGDGSISTTGEVSAGSVLATGAISAGSVLATGAISAGSVTSSTSYRVGPSPVVMDVVIVCAAACPSGYIDDGVRWNNNSGSECHLCKWMP